jgi:quinol monooxygenase YgiN
MNAKVVKFQFREGRRDDVIHLFEEFVVPGAKRQKGFMGGMLLTDPHTNYATSIALWETEGDIKASEASGYYKEWVVKLGDLLIRVPSREIYEVINLFNLPMK